MDGDEGEWVPFLSDVFSSWIWVVNVLAGRKSQVYRIRFQMMREWK